MGNGDGWAEGRIDPALRDRIELQFHDLMRTLDAALQQPTPQTYDEVRDASDRLMRASAALLLALSRAEQNGH